MRYGIPALAAYGPPPAGSVPMQLPKSIVRIGEQAIWSAFRYPDTTALANTEDRLFTAPRGQVAQGFAAALSLAETNLKEGGRIPGGFAFSVEGVSAYPYYIGGSGAGTWAIDGGDIRNFVDNCVISWDFIQTRIEIGPALLVGAGGGVYGTTADTGAAEGGAGGSRMALNNGNGQIWLYSRHPVALPADVTFAMVLNWGTNASVVDGGLNNAALGVRIHLIGSFESAIPTA